MFTDEFVSRFAAHAGAAAKLIQQHAGLDAGPDAGPHAGPDALAPIYCPINEMSFWA